MKTDREKKLEKAAKELLIFLETYPPYFKDGKSMRVDLSDYVQELDDAIKS